MSNYHVDRILEEKKITDFLQENGIHPVKKSGDKWIYLCPVHSGDSSPSFYVYPVGTKGRNYQTYHCFGCHSGINIVNLKSDLDNISIKESIRFFLKDVKIDSIDAMDSAIDAIMVDMGEEADGMEAEGKRTEFLMLSLNALCRNYLSEYGDNDEVKFFDEVFYKRVDELAIAKDADTLDEYFDMLMERDVLANRGDAIKKRREEEDLSASEWII